MGENLSCVAEKKEGSKPCVTILTPTYNDASYIRNLISSVMDQDYLDWEWIIINDGSTDDTENILEEIKDSRVKVLRKKNGDQLNALLFSLPYINGDIVTIIHSDDVFFEKNSISSCVEKLMSCEADGIYSDYKIIDEHGHHNGVLSTPTHFDAGLKVRTLLTMGGNLIGDPFFIYREFFYSHVVENYLKDNTIYYFGYGGDRDLVLAKSSPWYCYRVFSENYIHSDVGQFVATSGQFRTVTKLINSGVQPGINLLFGYFGFRFFRNLRIHVPWVNHSTEYIGSQVFRFWEKDISRFKYPSILRSMASAISHSYSIDGDLKAPFVWEYDRFIKDYSPPDARSFFIEYAKGGIHERVLSLLSKDFDHIVAEGQSAKEQVILWLRFFSLQYRVIER